jgi:XTP/dITP diphosphohydrolase
MKPTLVVATNNAHKLEELRALLTTVAVRVCSVREVLGRDINVEEDGATFDANAAKKAETLAAETMLLTLADDSGLEVDALDGAPGVYSARFAGPRSTDAENNALLVQKLSALQASDPRFADGQFTARFRCVLALTDPLMRSPMPAVTRAPTNSPPPSARGGASASTLLVSGRCEGYIALTARGQHGFGYDPLFLVGHSGKTMAEHSAAEKAAVGHRGDAFRKFKLVLEKVLLVRSEQARIGQ